MLARGFSLVEIVFSLFVVSIGALTLALYLPAALRAQQFGRAQLYAQTHVVSLIEQFCARSNAHESEFFSAECNQPWDLPVAYRAYAPDLETRCTSVGAGLIPLPRTIAYRLDSDNDEIAQLLNAGGDVFYASPLPSLEIPTDMTLAPRPAPEAKRLIFGISGYPQQNALGYIPWQGVPYRTAYPSPPLHIQRKQNNIDPADYFAEIDASTGLPDTDLAFVMSASFANPTGTICWTGQASSGYVSQQQAAEIGDIGWLRAKGYFVTAWWYAARQGLPAEFLDGTATDAHLEAITREPNHLRALRILAHAGLCLTKDFSRAPSAGFPDVTAPAGNNGSFVANGAPRRKYYVPPHPGLDAGVPIPGDELANMPTIPGRQVPSGGLTMTNLLALNPSIPPCSFTIPSALIGSLTGHVYVKHALILRWHELCMQAIMRAAAQRPYDWRFPRPYNRMIMMDHPLVQFDVVPESSQLSGTIFGSGVLPCGSQTARQWRPVAAGDINGLVQAGINGLGTAVDWASLDGNIAHFSLSATFAAAERCREIVVWAADWQSYADAETQPSAPVDASRYPRAHTGEAFTSTDGWLTRLQFWDPWQSESRNPEKKIAFMRPLFQPFPAGPLIVAGGQDVRRIKCGPDIWLTDNQNGWYSQAFSDNQFSGPSAPGGPARGNNWPHMRPDFGYLGSPTDTLGCPQARFVGLYGADRNGNNRLDIGPIPPAIRLRATTVGRYLYYDPRLYLSLR